MKKSLVVLLALTALLHACSRSPNPEPTFHLRPVSYWVSAFRWANIKSEKISVEKATTALKTLDMKAVPFVLTYTVKDKSGEVDISETINTVGRAMMAISADDNQAKQYAKRRQFRPYLAKALEDPRNYVKAVAIGCLGDAKNPADRKEDEEIVKKVIGDTNNLVRSQLAIHHFVPGW
jgi:hypothetical protein